MEVTTALLSSVTIMLVLLSQDFSFFPIFCIFNTTKEDDNRAIDDVMQTFQIAVSNHAFEEK